MWLSTNPFQLGEFLCYDLNEVFSVSYDAPKPEGVYIDSLSIPADPFLKSDEYEKFLRYKELKNRLFDYIIMSKDIEWNAELEKDFIQSNPESYITYLMLGDYHLESGNTTKAEEYYTVSLSKEVASKQEREHIQNNLESCKK